MFQRNNPLSRIIQSVLIIGIWLMLSINKIKIWCRLQTKRTINSIPVNISFYFFSRHVKHHVNCRGLLRMWRLAVSFKSQTRTVYELSFDPITHEKAVQVFVIAHQVDRMKLFRPTQWYICEHTDVNLDLSAMAFVILFIR